MIQPAASPLPRRAQRSVAAAMCASPQRRTSTVDAARGNARSAVFAEAVADRPDDELHRAVRQRIGRDTIEAAPTRDAEVGRDLRQQRIGDPHHRLAGEAGERQQRDGGRVARDGGRRLAG